MPRGQHNASKTHCSKGHEYTEENTYRNPAGRRWCRTCMKINSQIQNIKRYGITTEQVEEMLIKQAFRCNICLRKFGEDGGAPHVDHDHKCCSGPGSCGKCVRGLLCRDCNRGLGSFADDIYRLMAAVDYLKTN